MKAMRGIFVLAFFLPMTLFARIILVDINGSGQFISIVQAVNAAVNNDTVKVLPG